MNTIINKDEPPHLVNGENCMGFHESYWRQFLFCSDGRVVCGTGLTEEEATRKANEQRIKRETFLKSPARQRIKDIISKYGPEGYPLACDQGDLNRAFAEVLECI